MNAYDSKENTHAHLRLDGSDPSPRARSQPPKSRAGSALLIVIGTLALISVFAVVYLSIGRTDRRAANAVRSHRSQIDSSEEFADYLSGVIIRDRFDSVPYHGTAAAGSVFGRLEATDAPYTDWTRRSEADPNEEYKLFTPWGGVYAGDGVAGRNDHRVASDPWLASTNPAYLGRPGYQNAERPFSRYEAFDLMFPNAKNFLDNRDWLQISNFAPDGRFVNLFNLRPNAGFDDSQTSGPFGGFYNDPGITPPGDGYTDTAGKQLRRMSNYLSLLKLDDPANPESVIRAFDPAMEGIWVPGANAPVPGIIPADEIPNTPAVWTMYQRFMLLPMNQPFISLNRRGDVATWADPDYPPYQYADADADGFADSRWIELVAARDASEGGSSSSPREDVESLYNNKGYRYFLAARAVDLSSMVNVNTATDQLVPPTIAYPMGATPADVDLRRLLTMQDAASNYTAYQHNLPLSPAQLHRPYREGDEPPFGPWIPAQASGWADRNLRRNVADYWVYKQEFERPASGTHDLRRLENDSTSMLIGRYAYDALRRGISLGNSLSRGYKGYDPDFTAPSTITDLVQFERDPTTGAQTQITAEQRYNQYMNVGRLDPSNSGSAWSRDTGFNAALYGLDDLTELLTYHGLNDPDVTSRLELVTSGRYESPTNGTFDDILQTRRFGPLMSNRPLELDRSQHGIALKDIRRDPSVAPSADDIQLRDVNGRVSFNSMAQLALSPRRRLTTISGQVPLLPSVRVDEAARSAVLDAQSAAPLMTELLSSESSLFDAYSRALAGELDTPESVMANNSYWPDDVTKFQSHLASTAFYGHRGPELALRIAAHAALNMKDLTDNDTDPSIATLVLDSAEARNIRTTLQGDVDPNDGEYQLYPGLADDKVFNPESQLPTESYLSTALPAERKLVNVYGMDAAPVITEVSVLYAYTDASKDVGGDKDYNEGPEGEPRLIPGGGIDYPARDDIDNFTIDGGVDASNPDYLVQVLAIQLHNPYDQAISLGGNDDEKQVLPPDAPLTRHHEATPGPGGMPMNSEPIDTGSNYMFDYYIEYAGRFYKLAKYLDWYPTENNPSESYFNIDEDPMYASVPNPATAIDRMIGGRLDPGTQDTGTANESNHNNIATYSDFMARNVVLGAHQTRVFYVIADRRFDGGVNPTAGPDKRWTDILTTSGTIPRGFTSAGASNDADGDTLPDGVIDSRGWTGPAEEWVQHQLTVIDGGDQVEPVMMMEFDPRDGELLDGNGFTNPVQVGASIYSDASRKNISEVRLWKKIATRGEETTDPMIDGVQNPIKRNLVENDLLVDRMSILASLDAPIVSGPVMGTVSFREDFGAPGTPAAGRNARNDNTGVTIASWVTNRRADSPTQEKPGAGQVTPWMLRSRATPSASQTSHLSTLATTLDVGAIYEGAGDLTDPETGVTIKGDFEIQNTLKDFFDLARSSGAGAIVQTLALAPRLKNDVTSFPAGDPAYVDADGANGSATKFPPFFLSLPPDANLDPMLGAVPEILVNGTNIKDRPRLADLLLAWGIGPAYAPDPARGAGDVEYIPEERMTASEAMGIALGLDNPSATATATTEPVDMVWNDTNLHTPASPNNVLEDGHLSLGDFVAYLNIDRNDPPTFDSAIDIRRGTGAPMALGIIDQARAIEPLVQVTDPGGTLTPAQQLRLTLGRATFGTININTAPVEVLRLLPGLTPSRASYIVSGAYKNEWWGKDLTGTNLPDLSTASGAGAVFENPDVAAAIVAYRDRSYGVPISGSRPEAYVNFYDNAPMNLQPTVPAFMAQNMQTEDSLTVPAPVNPDDPLNRGTMTGIDALRETPGFGSLGELLAVRIDPDFNDPTSPSYDTARWDNLKHLSIDQYGHDEKVSGLDNETTIMGQLFAGATPGTTRDDYAEKLAMADAVLNTISVRSDYFAVWFIVQGYQESDVKNLRPQDPLVPSIRKRYLMVVDRSHAVSAGDKPRILVLKEIPL